MKKHVFRPALFGLLILIPCVLACRAAGKTETVRVEPKRAYAATAVPGTTPGQVFLSVQGPSPTPSPTPTPVPTSPGLLGGRYDGFSYKGTVVTEDSYRSENVSVQVTSISVPDTYKDYMVYYMADIHVQDVESLRTAAAGKSFKSMDAGFVKNVGNRFNAVVACSGDYYVNNKGLLIRNGELYRNMKGKYDICVLYRDGTMKTFLPEEYEKDDIIAADPWQVWSFGPALINADGTARKNFGKSTITQRNPRCMIGYYEPGHYALVLVDGRQSRYSMGLTLEDLAKFAVDLGFKVAYNLDGGKSAVMCWQGEVFNKPQDGGRSVSDIVYIAPEE